MPTDNEKLYVVNKEDSFKGFAIKTWVFRTRAAARWFAEYQNKKSKRFHYRVRQASWGYEQ